MYLNRESQLVDIRADIESRTQKDISEQQRAHFLQQQIRTIQDELGDTDEHDIDELYQRAEQKLWNEDVKNTFKKEMRKLERLQPQTPDYSVQYNYLETLLDLPWNEYTEDNFDISNAEKQLDKDHFGLDKVKERILEHLAVLAARRHESPNLMFIWSSGSRQNLSWQVDSGSLASQICENVAWRTA